MDQQRSITLWLLQTVSFVSCWWKLFPHSLLYRTLCFCLKLFLCRWWIIRNLSPALSLFHHLSLFFIFIPFSLFLSSSLSLPHNLFIVSLSFLLLSCLSFSILPFSFLLVSFSLLKYTPGPNGDICWFMQAINNTIDNVSSLVMLQNRYWLRISFNR